MSTAEEWFLEWVTGLQKSAVRRRKLRSERMVLPEREVEARRFAQETEWWLMWLRTQRGALTRI